MIPVRPTLDDIRDFSCDALNQYGTIKPSALVRVFALFCPLVGRFYWHTRLSFGKWDQEVEEMSRNSSSTPWRRITVLIVVPAMPLFLLAMCCTSFGVASADEVSWIHGLAPPDTWRISPSSPLNTDVIRFCSPIREKEVYDNSCLAEQAMLGTLSLSTNPVTRDIVLCFEPPGPETCPSDPDPVCGLEGSFGPLEAGEWTFWIKFPGRIRFGSFQVGSVYYVDVDSSAAGAGASWADAFRYLQDALDKAASCDQIRVAQGTYLPDHGAQVELGDREATFQLQSGVTIKGGYAGFGEPDPDARDIDTYETILSGDLHANDIVPSDSCDLLNEPTRLENSYHVVTASGTDAKTVLDGFTITAGNANRFEPHNNGAGLYNSSGSPTIRNCRLCANSAGHDGAGMWNSNNSRPVLANCTIANNMVVNDAGGLCVTGQSDVSLTNCLVSNNSAGNDGGGLCGTGRSDVSLTDCVISDNRAGNDAGGVMCERADLTLVKATISNNRAANDGGGIWNGSVLMLYNCLISGNSAGEYGGGIYNWECSSTLTNCTFSGNSALIGIAIAYDGLMGNHEVTNSIIHDGTASVWNNQSLTIAITHSNVQGRQPEHGNIDADPLFAEPNDQDYHLKSQAGRWDTNSQNWVQDQVTSPCVDAGDPMATIGYEPFPNGGIINMGAFGGTAEASKSYFGKTPCETIVAGDLNGDCLIDFRDFFFIALHWLEQR